MEIKGFSGSEISETERTENDTNKKNNNEDINSKDCDDYAEKNKSRKMRKQGEKVQNSSVYIGIAGAVTKLQEELKKAKEKDFAKLVIEHLIERCKDSESLASDVCQEHKTWEKCIRYLYNQAEKQIPKQDRHGTVTVPLSSDTVFEWAEDYYHKDDKEEEEKKAREAAERKKKQAERAKKAKSEPQKAETPKPKEEPKLKKNSKDMDGQLDMFSMMGM